MTRALSRRTFIASGFVLLFVLHQDVWWKDDPALVFGILPVSLAYHVVWTLFIAAGWLLVVRHAWPDVLDETSANQSLAINKTGDKGSQAKSQSK